MRAHAYIAWAPRGDGLTAALFYVVREAAVSGWLAREHDKHCLSAFFVLDDRSGSPRARFRRSVSDKIDSRWIEHATPLSAEIACPMSAPDRRWLSHLQAAYVRRWFFRADDAGEGDEVVAYASQGLPLHPLNLRSTQFGHFDRRRPVWVYASPAIDFDLVLYLKRRLPQDSHEAQLLA